MAEVLVPIKDFGRAKVRLADALPAERREALARAMAARVLAAAAPLPVSVVCDTDEVADFARRHGADVIWAPADGLNEAVTAAVTELAGRGVDRAVVSHADLPLATALAPLADFDGATLVPDRHGDGTNVACVPTASGFEWAYGPGSFARHADEARRLGLGLRTLRSPELSWDVDHPADLRLPAGHALPDELVDLFGLTTT